MDFSTLVLCLFVLLCQAEGDVRGETLYVKTGTDLLLDVGEPVTLKENDDMFWNFNTVQIVKLSYPNKTAPNPIYAKRAEISLQNQSLLLKNVQKTDSGEYRAGGVFGFTNRDLVKYQVTVLDPVSDVKLEVKQCSSDRSDLNVTCTTLDGLLNSTFICDKTTCSYEGGEPVQDISSGASLQVYRKTGSVTCHHRNNASFTKDTKTIVELCGPVKDAYSSAEIFGPIIGVLIVAVCAAGVVYYCHHRKKCDRQDVENTDYAEPAALQRDLRPGPGQRNGAQGESPDSIYVLAGAPTAAPTQTPTETNVKTQPESLYATVDKTTKS